MVKYLLKSGITFFIVISAVFGLFCSKAQAAEMKSECNGEKRGYIFIGDSRMVGIENTCHISSREDTFVIAKVGSGYNWLIDTAVPKMEEIMSEETGYGDWVVVMCLGINDLRNCDKYANAYNILKSKYKIVCVSVNPVEWHSSITNEQIASFNNRLQKLTVLPVIDTYSALIEKGCETVDGIHFSNMCYRIICGYMLKGLDAFSKAGILG